MHRLDDIEISSQNLASVMAAIDRFAAKGDWQKLSTLFRANPSLMPSVVVDTYLTAGRHYREYITSFDAFEEQAEIVFERRGFQSRPNTMFAVSMLALSHAGELIPQ